MKSVVGIDVKVFIYFISFIWIWFLRIEIKKIIEGYIIGNSLDRDMRLFLIWEIIIIVCLRVVFSFVFRLYILCLLKINVDFLFSFKFCWWEF